MSKTADTLEREPDAWLSAKPIDPTAVDIQVAGARDERTRAQIEQRIREVVQRAWATAPSEWVGLSGHSLPSVDSPNWPHVGLTGWEINNERQGALREIIKDAISDLGEQDEAVCIAVHRPRGDRIATDGDPIWWDDAGNWVNPPSGEAYWNVAIALDAAPFNVAQLLVFNGLVGAVPWSKREAMIGLRNFTDWHKEVRAVNLFTGGSLSLVQAGNAGATSRMRLSQVDEEPATVIRCNDGHHTIEFHKPGFAGFWHPVGHFDAEHFWKYFGGTRADFRWKID
jgi:hypothetical protein